MNLSEMNILYQSDKEGFKNKFSAAAQKTFSKLDTNELNNLYNKSKKLYEYYKNNDDELIDINKYIPLTDAEIPSLKQINEEAAAKTQNKLNVLFDKLAKEYEEVLSSIK